MFRIALLGLISILLQTATASAQSEGRREDCFGINTADPQAVFRCLNSFSNRDITNPRRGCSDIQGSWTTMLHWFGTRHDQQYLGTVPSCPVIAEAVRLATGKPSVWSGCLITAPGTASTETHLKACLQGWYPPSFNGQSVAALKNCDEVFNYYEMALRDATPRALSLQTNVPSAVAPRHGPSPFIDPSITSDGFGNPKLKRRDCNLAARVQASFAYGTPPRWAACLDYKPDAEAQHIKNCLGASAGSGLSCTDGRAAYETNLKGAYGGTLPANYRPITCDALNPLLARASKPAVIQPPQRPKNEKNVSEGSIIPILVVVVGFFFLALLIDYQGLRFFQKGKIAKLVETDFPIESHQALVLGSRTYSRTHVHGSSSGGDIYVGPGGNAHLSAPTLNISSTVQDRHEFFLQYENGFEQPVWINAQEFATREGQQVLALWSGGEKDKQILAIYNNASRDFSLFDAYIAAKAMTLPVGSQDWAVRGTLILAAILVYMLLGLGLWSLAIATLIAALGYRIRQTSIRSWGAAAISAKLRGMLPS
jgi:hypothetical protein